jgi:hypothetical protein
MAETPQIYFTTLTAVGEAKDANAKALGIPLKFTEIAVGDGNGALPVPDKNRTALVRQVRRAPLNTLKADPANPGQLIAEQIIPEDVGGWWIRELGLYDDAGDLVAIGNCPETYKPQLAQGSGRTQVVRMVLIMSSAATVQLKVDPSVVLATRKYVDDQDALARQAATDQAAAHVAAADPHTQYLTKVDGAAKIQAAVQALVNSSPATLDTLAELAAALNNDKDFAVTMTNALALKAPMASPGLTGTVTVTNSQNSPGLALKGKPASAIAADLAISRTGSNPAFGQSPNLQFDDGTPANSRMIQGGGGILQFGSAAAGYWSEMARFDIDSNLLVQKTSGGNHIIRRNAATVGLPVLHLEGAPGLLCNFSAVDTWNVNAARVGFGIGSQSTTGRSINAGGTVNASGNDYAEYYHKAESVGVIAKGDIVGIDVDGHLTDKWEQAVSFMVKSTAPSYVGGDVWGNEEALGRQRPAEPTFDPAPYIGAAYPDEAKYQDDKAAYDTALASFEQDMAAHAAQMESDRLYFDAITMPAYQGELAQFEACLEEARQRVDRIAYCGQVPVNVTGAKPGQYLVPVQDGAGIAGQLVDANTITFDQYRRAVGIVQNVLKDGRANVRVKPV